MTDFHKNDPLSPDNVISDDEGKLLQIIDDVESPEQLKAAKELLFSDKPSEVAPEADKPKGEEVEKPKEVKEKPAETEKPAEKPAEPEAKKIIEVTDDYISQAEEKDRNILTSIKGETLSEKALKNYIESQRLIGKKATEIQQLQTPPEERKPREVSISDEQRSLIASMANKELRREYKDMPDDPEDRKEWLLRMQNTDPDELEKYYERRREVSNQLTEEYKQVLFVKENYDVINLNQMKKEVENIRNYFQDTYGLKLEDMGLKVEVDDDFSNEIINELLTLPNGEFDPKVVQYYDQKNKEVPIIEPGKLSEKFFLKFNKRAVEEVQKRARKEGFEARSQKKTVKELTDISPEKPGDAKTEVLKIEDIEDMTDLVKIRSLIEKVGDIIH